MSCLCRWALSTRRGTVPGLPALAVSSASSSLTPQEGLEGLLLLAERGGPGGFCSAGCPTSLSFSLARFTTCCIGLGMKGGQSMSPQLPEAE